MAHRFPSILSISVRPGPCNGRGKKGRQSWQVGGTEIEVEYKRRRLPGDQCRQGQPRNHQADSHLWASPSSVKKAAALRSRAPAMAAHVAGRPPRRHPLLYSHALGLCHQCGPPGVRRPGMAARPRHSWPCPTSTPSTLAARPWALGRTAFRMPRAPKAIRSDDDATPPSIADQLERRWHAQ